MINESITTTEPHHHLHYFRRISWTAILMGALVGLGLGFLLNLFGLAIGLTTSTLTNEGARVLAIGGLVGLLIGVIASMLAAGYAAGYLGRHYCPKRNLGILYGFSTWTLALLLSATAAGPLSYYLSAYAGAISPSVYVASEHPNATAIDTTVKTGTTKATPTSATASKNESTVTAPMSTLAWSASILFALFFIGALSSCIGACWAMHCKRED